MQNLDCMGRECRVFRLSPPFPHPLSETQFRRRNNANASVQMRGSHFISIDSWGIVMYVGKAGAKEPLGLCSRRGDAFCTSVSRNPRVSPLSYARMTRNECSERAG